MITFSLFRVEYTLCDIFLYVTDGSREQLCILNIQLCLLRGVDKYMFINTVNVPLPHGSEFYGLKKCIEIMIQLHKLKIKARITKLKFCITIIL